MIAEVMFTTEGIVVIGTLLAALAAAIGVLYRQIMLSNDQRVKELTDGYERQLSQARERTANWEQMSHESVSRMVEVANEHRLKQGKGPIKPLAAVVPEHQSPPTDDQTVTAKLATVRAALVAATLEMGLPPRTVEGTAIKEAESQAQEVKVKDVKGILPAGEKVLDVSQIQLKKPEGN